MPSRPEGLGHMTDFSKDVMISPLMDALDGRRLELAEHPSKGHFFTAYAMLHRRMERSLTRALEAIEKEEIRRRAEGLENNTKGNPIFALDAFQGAVYRACELFEFYEKDLFVYIPNLNSVRDVNSGKTFLKFIKDIKRRWGVLCNNYKHNHAFLVPVEGSYESGSWVTGYCLYSRVGDQLSVNKEAHLDCDAYSYNWSLRTILADIMLADKHAALAAKAATEDASLNKKMDCLGISLPYLNIIQKISDRSEEGLPKELLVERNFIKIFKEYGVEIQTRVPTVPTCKKFVMHIIFDILGPKLKIGFPYSDEYMEFSMTDNKTGNIPTTSGWYRLQVKKELELS